MDENGVVTSDEKLNAKIKEVFEKYDSDKNGTIEEEEFSNALLIDCKCNGFLTKDDVKSMFRVADIDGDAKLQFNEFRAIVNAQILSMQESKISCSIL